MKYGCVAWVVWCVLGLTGCGAPEKVSMVRPGVGVGDMRLGMTLGQVIATAGDPRVKKKLEDGMSYAYPSAGFSVYAPGSGGPGSRVTRISAGLGFIASGTEGLRQFWGKTQEGLGIGSTRAEVLAKYGPPEAGPVPQNYKAGLDQGLYVYHARGISFLFQDGKVVRLIVFLPQHAPEMHSATAPTSAP